MHIYIPPDSQLLQDYKKFAQRIGLIGATNLFIGLSGIILLPILTKTMPIEEYGTYVQVTVTIGLVPSIVMLGLPYTMVRYLAAAKSKEDVQEGYYSILGITVITSGVTSIIIFLLAGPIANALFDGHFEVTQILAAIVFLECMNGLQFNYFRTFQHIKRYSALTFSKTLVQLTLVGAFVLLDHGIFGAMIGLLITDLILFAIMGILIVSEIDVVFPKFKNLREYLSFGLPTVPGNVSSWVVNSSDRYVIALFLGAAYVGYYSPGYTLGNTISMFIAPLSFMLPAVLSKYYDEGDLGTVKTILSYSTKYFVALTIPSIIGLTLLSKPLLTILSTAEIAENSYLITPITALCAALFGIYTIAVQLLILQKKTRHMGFIWFIAAGVNIILNILCIPIFGLMGAALTTLLSFLIATAYIIHHSNMASVVSIEKRFLAKCCIAALCLGMFVVSSNPQSPLDILITALSGGGIYAITLFLLRGFSSKELKFFKRMVKQSS